MGANGPWDNPATVAMALHIDRIYPPRYIGDGPLKGGLTMMTWEQPIDGLCAALDYYLEAAAKERGDPNNHVCISTTKLCKAEVQRQLDQYIMGALAEGRIAISPKED